MAVKMNDIKSVLYVIALALTIVSCGNSDSVIVYRLIKSTLPDKPQEWSPSSPTTYHMEANSVVTERAGILTKYENCIVASVDDWECPHRFKSGSFGFKNGKYWGETEDHYIESKIVSRFEYGKTICKSWLDSDISALEKLTSCFSGFVFDS
jgi:hypothetical protein